MRGALQVVTKSNRELSSKDTDKYKLYFWSILIFRTRMKLALMSLTLCCCVYVSVTYQQQHQFMSRRYPLPYYYNSYYDSPQQLSRNYWMGQQDPSFFGQQNNNIQPQNPSFDPLMVIINYLIPCGVNRLNIRFNLNFKCIIFLRIISFIVF